MSKIVEITLSSGWRVRCRAVPTLAFQGLMRKSEFWYPPPPVVEIPVQKGTKTETVPAPEGSPEYIEYQDALKQIEKRKYDEQQWFCYSYGVVEWAEGEKGRWLKNPPKGWNVDPALVDALGIEEMPRRTAFIMYDLLGATSDLGRVDEVILDLDKEPLKGGEVQATEDSFQGDVEGA
jgi:hypothetical protein